MDLNDINLAESAENGEWMELRHPVTDSVIEHDGKPMRIKLAGTDSAAYRRKEKELTGRRLQKLSRGKKPDFSNVDSDANELLAAVTLDWFIFMGGEAIKCNEHAARKLYEEQPWIKEQVNEFVGDRANFFKDA